VTPVLRTLHGPEELAVFEQVRSLAFGVPFDPERADHLAGVAEYDRMLVAADGDTVVATAAAFSFRVSVPGATDVAAAGIKAIAVLPTHRRRGTLTTIMRGQLDDFHARGEPLAVLWASENAIYPRFGFGMATTSLSWAIARGAPFLPEPERAARQVLEAGRLRLLDDDKAAAVVPPVYERLRSERPGMIERSAAWWQRRLDRVDHPIWAVVEDTDGVAGYLVYTVAPAWSEIGPANRVRVEEFVALTADAEAALARFVVDLDLAATISAAMRPPDDAVAWMLSDPRALRRALSDGMWVRLVDVRSALTARRYRAPMELTLEVIDDFCPWNATRWRLETGDGAVRPRCRPAPARAATDITLGVGALAAAYLGGVPFRTLERAGQVMERRSGAVERADAAFGWSPEPWAGTYF
jgi:predicted acetyltransferase